jgi:hypothetical protein
MLKDLKPIQEFYPHFTCPNGEEYFTDPTYWFYREGLLDLLKASGSKITNCTEAGLCFGEGITWMELEAWLESL